MSVTGALWVGIASATRAFIAAYLDATEVQVHWGDARDFHGELNQKFSG